MAAVRNILVLGATGATGLVFVKAALAHSASPELTLLVRTPSKLPTEWTSHPRITVVQGALTDASAVATAMKGVTSVVSFLGAYITLSNFLTRDTSTPIADALASTVFPAMRNAGVKRFMVLSSVGGFQRPGDYVPYGKYWLFSYVAPKVVVPGGAAEMKRIGEVTAASGDEIEWTVFRIPHLNDGDAEGELEVKAAANVDANYNGGLELSRGSLVRWVLGEIEERKWVREAPVLGNPW